MLKMNVIISNATDGWFYYSLNGTESHAPVGLSKNPDVGTLLGNNGTPSDLAKLANNVHTIENIISIDTFM